MKMLKYIFPQRREPKMVLPNLQSYQLSTNILFLNQEDAEHPKITLLPSLYKQNCNFTCTQLVHKQCFSSQLLMQQVSQGGIKHCCGSEVTSVNSCVTHACRLHSFADVGKKDSIQETQIPQYGAVVTELRNFTVPQAFRATKSLTTLLNCICMKHYK